MPRNPTTPAIFPMIRVATLNIGLARLHLLGLTLREGVPYQQARLPAILAYLARNAAGADVWLLQEAYGRGVARRLGLTPGFRAVAARAQGPDTGLVMLVRKGLSIGNAESLPLPAVDWVERFVARKGLQCIDLAIDGHRFRVGNLHTSYDGRGKAEVAARAPASRRQQITMALDSLERDAQDSTLILGGDFNASAVQEPETFAIGHARGWLDARVDAESHDAAGVMTWSRENPVVRGDAPDQDIDHIWIRPPAGPVRIVSRHVATRRNAVTPDGTAIPLSDHYGLVADIDQGLPSAPQAGPTSPNQGNGDQTGNDQRDR